MLLRNGTQRNIRQLSQCSSGSKVSAIRSLRFSISKDCIATLAIGVKCSLRGTGAHVLAQRHDSGRQGRRGVSHARTQTPCGKAGEIMMK
jgi:hypothetical protein